MSAPIAVVLDVEAVHVVAKGGDAKGVAIPWTLGGLSAVDAVNAGAAVPHGAVDVSDTMQRVVSTARALGHAPSGVVVVVGLGFLEIAEPELPPMSAASQRTLLLRDADRYFPMIDLVAVVMEGRLAFAAPAEWLHQCTSALADLGPVRAIMAAPMLTRATSANGTTARDTTTSETVIIPAGHAETGHVVFRHGTLQEVRRVPTGRAPLAVSGTPISDRHLNAAQLGQAALAYLDAPLTHQLLDATLQARVHGIRVRRVAASVAFAVVAVVLFIGAADRWRAQVFDTARQYADSLEVITQPAQVANQRLQRATTELQQVADARMAQHTSDAPLTVLAHLSRALPRDVVVQKLEWNGAQWRVEGTADNAPRLIPLLDGDGHFHDVRVASSGQRFVDFGRQRESFAITFLMVPSTAPRDPVGGADGQP